MTNSEGAALRAWQPGAHAPNAQSRVLAHVVALDREWFECHDGSLSRAANAPKLRAAGAAFELLVPEASAWPVSVLQGVRFEALQYGLPPAQAAWKVAPAELKRPGQLVAAARASAGLVRALLWDRAEHSHFLLPLPPVLHVERGASALIQAPAVLVIGGAALDITPVETLSPAALPAETAASEPAALTLSPLLRALGDEDARAALACFAPVAAPPAKAYALPGAPTPVADDSLLAAAQALLLELDAPFRFVPLLEEGVRPRLGLALRHAGRAQLLVSGPDPVRFLDQLQERLAAPRPVTRPSAPPAPSSVIPRAPLAQLHGVRTKNPRLASVLQQLERVADSDLRVLFLGESGTGKEHLARTLHAASPRAPGPFVAVNCSAIGEQLIESELFGHRKGAFTGAHHDRAGAFVTAQLGTLLLDELGDAPLRVQLALLRALETRRIKPVGSDREQEIDVRVLAATSADVRALMHSGHFREDLYFRLAELVVDVPPLRARPEDVPDLVETLLKRLNATSRLSPQALDMLIAYSFPGNVRELENALKRALALSRGATTLEAVHFSQLGPVMTTTAMVEFQFPATVRELANRIWAEPRGAETEGSKYEQRARVRAALLEIGSRFPLEAWPKALQTQWSRLFGAKWATTEGGRNVREVARELGLEARREESERRVLGLVRGVVMRRVG